MGRRPQRLRGDGQKTSVPPGRWAGDLSASGDCGRGVLRLRKPGASRRRALPSPSWKAPSPLPARVICSESGAPPSAMKALLLRTRKRCYALLRPGRKALSPLSARVICSESGAPSSALQALLSRTRKKSGAQTRAMKALLSRTRKRYRALLRPGQEGATPFPARVRKVPHSSPSGSGKYRTPPSPGDMLRERGRHQRLADTSLTDAKKLSRPSPPG